MTRRSIASALAHWPGPRPRLAGRPASAAAGGDLRPALRLGPAVCLMALLSCVTAAQAAAPQAAAVTPPAAVTPQPDEHSPARVNTRGEPAVEQRVLEDEHIVIEELMVRGQAVRISVRGKTSGARGYEVNVGPGGRDPSQESGRAGQSAWRLFSF